MRDFYGKYFKINDNERISDKKMLINVITTVTMVVVCLAMMSMVAFSYYNYSIRTGSSTVTVAESRFNVSIEVLDVFDNNTVVNDNDNATVNPTTVNNYTKDFNLTENAHTYKVTLTMDGNEQYNGYCKIMFGNSNGLALDSSGKTLIFETPQMGKGLQGGDRTTFSFKVTLAENLLNSDNSLVTLRVMSSWGSSASSNTKLTDDCTLTVNHSGEVNAWNITKS